MSTKDSKDSLPLNTIIAVFALSCLVFCASLLGAVAWQNVTMMNAAWISVFVMLASSGWNDETTSADKPDFSRIAKDSTNNVRDALNRLEVELLGA